MQFLTFVFFYLIYITKTDVVTTVNKLTTRSSYINDYISVGHTGFNILP